MPERAQCGEKQRITAVGKAWALGKGDRNQDGAYPKFRGNCKMMLSLEFKRVFLQTPKTQRTLCYYQIYRFVHAFSYFYNKKI